MSIADGVRKNQELMEKNPNRVYVNPSSQISPIPQETQNSASAPVRSGAFTNQQILSTDLAKTERTSAPIRSSIFPTQPKSTITSVSPSNAAIKAAKASLVQTQLNAPSQQTSPTVPVTTGTQGPLNPTNPISKNPPFPGPPHLVGVPPVQLPPSPPLKRPTPIRIPQFPGAIRQKISLLDQSLPVNVSLDQVTDSNYFQRINSSHSANNVAYNFRGVWDSATSYVQGDEVIFLSSYWLCLAPNTNSQPATTGNANWQVVASYSAFTGAWSSTTTYIAGDEVTFGGNFWVSTDTNLNSSPSLTNPDWQIAGPVALDNVADGNGSGGGTYQRMPIANMDVNRRGLIDLTQMGHIGSLANHYEMVVAASPVSYWKLDEKSGTSAIDSTTNARTGTYHGGFALAQVSAIAGEVGTVVGGGSVELNGTTGYMQVPFSSALNPSVFSVAFWVFPESTPTSEFALAQSGTSSTGWQFNQQPSGNIYAYLNGTTSVPGAVAGLGAWNHYVLTYNGTAANLYHSGVLVGSTTVTFSANTTKDIFLGTDSTVGVGFFHGRFDEFAIFNTALSAQQVAGLYQAGSVGPHRTVDDVPNGATYLKPLYVNGDGTYHVSTGLNNQVSLVGSPAASPSYTSTTTSITWSWGAFTVYFPDGSTIAVSSGSQGFTGLTANTTYYFEFYVVKATGTMTCVMSDNSTAPASVQFLAQTVGADGHAIEITDITAATPSSGTGGGSGGGGTCFSGDTRIKTDKGFVRMDELPDEFNIVNQTGLHRALRIVHTYRDDELLVMPNNGLVTPGHMMQKGETWVPARDLFSEKAPKDMRTLYDIQVVTGNPEDMHYILENGYVAHNKSRVSCFDGEAQVLTIAGWVKFKDLPEKFRIVNSKGTFDARLFQHRSLKANPPRMRLLPEGGTVTDDHIVRPMGETDWRHAEELLPASTNFPETVYNIISDGGYYRVGNLEARALEGNSR